MFLAEELITRLLQSGSFEVVERRLLDKVLEEQKMSTTGLLGASLVQKTGSILGVNAIATGTVTDLQSSVKVNARIISARTGTVSARAGETITKDADVSRLLSAAEANQHDDAKKSATPPGRPMHDSGAVPIPRSDGNLVVNGDFRQDISTGWMKEVDWDRTNDKDARVNLAAFKNGELHLAVKAVTRQL
jgi:hypothetical protein